MIIIVSLWLFYVSNLTAVNILFGEKLKKILRFQS